MIGPFWKRLRRGRSLYLQGLSKISEVQRTFSATLCDGELACGMKIYRGWVLCAVFTDVGVIKISQELSPAWNIAWKGNSARRVRFGLNSALDLWLSGRMGL